MEKDNLCAPLGRWGGGPTQRQRQRGHSFEVEILPSPLLVVEEEKQRALFLGTRLVFRSALISPPRHIPRVSRTPLTPAPPPRGSPMPPFSALSVQSRGSRMSRCPQPPTEICSVEHRSCSSISCSPEVDAFTSCSPKRVDASTSFSNVRVDAFTSSLRGSMPPPPVPKRVLTPPPPLPLRGLTPPPPVPPKGSMSILLHTFLRGRTPLPPVWRVLREGSGDDHPSCSHGVGLCVCCSHGG